MPNQQVTHFTLCFQISLDLSSMKKNLLIQFTTLIFGSIYWAFPANFIVEYSTENYLFDDLKDVPQKETALVLGARKNGKTGINPYFQYRIDAAAELYFAGKVKKIIFSGDNHCVGYDETTDMAESLIEKGVPDSCIIRDYAGFRTLDSVVRAQKVFHCNSLIIVSQKFHNQRAVFIAKQYGIDAAGYHARAVTSKSNLTHIREFAAKFGAILDLFVLNRQPKFL